MRKTTHTHARTDTRARTQAGLIRLRLGHRRAVSLPRLPGRRFIHDEAVGLIAVLENNTVVNLRTLLCDVPIKDIV